ncbi:MAG: PAS domain S-box protein [Oligoflexales bacterium]|nr:PAS domain S-box protein [Oligoflexales bacterium]
MKILHNAKIPKGNKSVCRKNKNTFLDDLLQNKKQEDLLSIKDAALDSSIAGIVLGTLNGQLTYANRSFVNLVKIDENNTSCFSLKDFLPNSPKTDEVMNQLFKVGQWSGEHMLARSDGSQIDADMALVIVNDCAQKPIGIMLSCADITERKMAERKAKIMEAELVHKAKLAEIGLLTANIAHEINNPLAVLKYSIEYSMERLDHVITEDLEKSIKRQKIAIERIAGIVKGLKRHSRMDDENEVLINLNSIVEETIFFVVELYKTMDVNVEKRLDSQTPIIMGHPGKIQQIIMNLISNGKDAIKRNDIIEGKILLETSDEKEHVLLKISDNGCGITKENQENIFNPFFTTKAAGEGIGLGLSISKSLVQAMNGDLLLDSTPGKGTTFTLRLPRAKSQ